MSRLFPYLRVFAPISQSFPSFGVHRHGMSAWAVLFRGVDESNNLQRNTMMKRHLGSSFSTLKERARGCVSPGTRADRLRRRRRRG